MKRVGLRCGLKLYGMNPRQPIFLKEIYHEIILHLRTFFSWEDVPGLPMQGTPRPKQEAKAGWHWGRNPFGVKWHLPPLVPHWVVAAWGQARTWFTCF
jgi:hypothetical protein